MRVIIFGGYGTFGSLIAQELAKTGIPITIAGRDGSQAEAFARTIASRGAAADVCDPQSCREALTGHEVAVNCAGPFHALNPALLDACVAAPCHYVDIADDRSYCSLVRSYDARFRALGRAAVYGCSSLPAISGALGLMLREGDPRNPRCARVTLFIGNNNPKGGAAIRSLVKCLGKPIAAPQGIIRGFHDRELVPLPDGNRAAFNFDSPEYDLLPKLLGVREVRVKVCFEVRPANYALALLARLGKNYGERTARLLQWLGGIVRSGTSGGAVMTELFYDDGATRRAVLHARQDGQRMAALPCALAARYLCEHSAAGAMTAFELLGQRALLQQLQAAGFEMTVS